MYTIGVRNEEQEGKAPILKVYISSSTFQFVKIELCQFVHTYNVINYLKNGLKIHEQKSLQPPILYPWLYITIQVPYYNIVLCF